MLYHVKDILSLIVATGKKAIEAFLKGDFQICIMDVLLPDIDGYSLAKFCSYQMKAYL